MILLQKQLILLLDLTSNQTLWFLCSLLFPYVEVCEGPNVLREKPQDFCDVFKYNSNIFSYKLPKHPAGGSISIRGRPPSVSPNSHQKFEIPVL